MTGAGAGIGEGIARRLAAAGARVACVDIDLGGGAARGRRHRGGGRPGPGPGLRRQATLPRSKPAFDATADAFGGLDVLVNNAGIVIIKSFEETRLEEWDRTQRVNLRALFLTCQRAIPLLRASGRGAIVNIASMAALRFTVPHVPYAASKGGVVAFTRDLAFELAPEIRVNAVSPGPIATKMGGTDVTDEQLAAAGLQLLLGRMGQPEDIAEAVAYLASERAAYVTGQNLPVTGGAELATRPLLPEPG